MSLHTYLKVVPRHMSVLLVDIIVVKIDVKYIYKLFK